MNIEGSGWVESNIKEERIDVHGILCFLYISVSYNTQVCMGTGFLSVKSCCLVHIFPMLF